MNIIETKINEDKLQELIQRAEMADFDNIKLLVNYETLQIIEAQAYPRNITLKRFETRPFYMGYPFVVVKHLDFGVVQAYGTKTKDCTRITVYSDGTPPKIENNVKEEMIVFME